MVSRALLFFCNKHSWEKGSSETEEDWEARWKMRQNIIQDYVGWTEEGSAEAPCWHWEDRIHKKQKFLKCYRGGHCTAMVRNASIARSEYKTRLLAE